MEFKKHPFAVAALALTASAPFSVHAAGTLSFRSLSDGETVKGTLSSTACEVVKSGTFGVSKVRFFLNSTALNTDSTKPWQCSVDTRKFADGSYTLKAVSYDSSGRTTATGQVGVKIQNGTTGGSTGGGTTTNTPPTLSITSPASGATVKGSSVACAASASDGNGIKQVEFSIDGAWIKTDITSPHSCVFDSTKLADGAHTLKAVATDTKGGTTTKEVTFNVANTTSGGSTGGTTNTPPTLSITAPASGATVKGTSVACAATAADADGIKQVQFLIDGVSIKTDITLPHSCLFDSTKLADGAHTLTAVATDNKGGTTSSQVSFTVANTTSGGGTTNAAPSVSLTAPASGTVSGTITFAATASDTDGSIAKVEFYLVNSANQRTLIASDTTNDYGGTYNTAQLPNGGYQLMAVAFDNAGAQATTQRAVTISNTTSGGSTGGGSTGGGTDTTGGTGTSLPANGARAVATFESLGMYWTPGSDPGANGCSIRYRKKSESTWKQGLNMWYDGRNRECRGSLVHLQSGTEYAVEMGVGTNFTTGVNTRTWSENFPIAKTVQVASGSGTLNITEGGTPQGYVLYTGPATLDAANGADFNVSINAPYVIVRGLTMKGARVDGIRIAPNVTDVVIENNDISGWGRTTGNTVNGVLQQVDRDSGIRANCVNTPGSLQRVTIQRNKIHDPRYGANSWDGKLHPLGANGIEISHCGGNFVIRNNEITSPSGKYFKDGMGGQANFSERGFPSNDTDIYNNIVSHAWDDGIEIEGGNRNVRVWNNYIDQTAVGIANTVVHTGPLYVFRNVYNRSRRYALVSLDNDNRLYFSKSGTTSSWGDGRRYMFHNTLLQAKKDGVVNGLGAGEGIIGLSDEPLTNTVSRNNILQVWKAGSASIRTNGGGGNDVDYDLRNGSISAYSGAETNGIVGTPIYRSGHGWANWAGGNYQLDASSPGYDRGVRIPNFNDVFTGAGPDMGAHEGDTPPMPLGVSGTGVPGDAGGTDTTGGGTGSTGGVCSSITCAAQ